MLKEGKERVTFNCDTEIVDRLYALRAEPGNQRKSISMLVTEILAEALRDHKEPCDRAETALTGRG